jgi:Domain of unknown function (DUF4404)
MDKHFHDSLEQLQQEIEETRFVNAADERLLRELLDDIARLLESSERRREQHDSLVERLRGAIERFEESHPTLTTNMARLSEALGRIAV